MFNIRSKQLEVSTELQNFNIWLLSKGSLQKKKIKSVDFSNFHTFF